MKFASLWIAAFVLLSSAPTIAAPASKSAVVVPTRLTGWFPRRDEYQADLDLSLSDRLRMIKYAVLKREALSDAEQQCSTSDCLLAILNKYSVDAAVMSRVVNDQKETTTFHLFVRVALRRDDHPPELREREKMCVNCALSRVRDELIELTGATIAETPMAPSHTSPRPLPLSSPEPAPVQTDHTIENVYWSLGTLGAAAFLGGVVALGVEGGSNGGCAFDVASGERCRATMDTRPSMIASGIIATVGLIVAPVFYGLAVHERKKNKVHAWVAPTVGRNGAGLAVGGQF
jgi:hypothetical protein